MPTATGALPVPSTRSSIVTGCEKRKARPPTVRTGTGLTSSAYGALSSSEGPTQTASPERCRNRSVPSGTAAGLGVLVELAGRLVLA